MNLGNMMKQAKEMQAKMAEADRNIESIQVEGVAAGGAVKVILNGKGVPQSFKIDASMAGEDMEILEDLLIAAYNDGKKKADDESAKEMSKATSGLRLPPGMNFPF
ncbi:MAG: YbaB/EbfC family nucleoid-associated protein [Alphaproteobacteria bacterium]